MKLIEEIYEKFWSDVSPKTVLYREIPGRWKHLWVLSTGDPEVAKKVKKLPNYRLKDLPGIGKTHWMFNVTFRSINSAFKSFSGIIGKPSYYDKESTAIKPKVDGEKNH